MSFSNLEAALAESRDMVNIIAHAGDFDGNKEGEITILFASPPDDETVAALEDLSVNQCFRESSSSKPQKWMYRVLSPQSTLHVAYAIVLDLEAKGLDVFFRATNAEGEVVERPSIEQQKQG